ncbi:MAG: lysophospholipid acyltransferase family protein [Pseudomonadales bacterium]
MSTEQAPVRRRMRNRTRRPGRIAGLVVRGLFWGLSQFPLTLARGLLGLFATLSWYLGTRGKKVALTNLGHCRPDLTKAEQRRLARSCAKQTAWLVAEQGMVWYWPRERWAAMIDDRAARVLLDHATADGTQQNSASGTLLLVPHLGNWELLSLYLGTYGVTALYNPPKLVSLDVPIRQARERNGARLLPIDRSGLKGLLTALDEGGLVAILPDQVPEPSAGVYAPFFGQPALTMTLAHRLIQRTEPTVLVAALLRTEQGFELVVQQVDEQIADPDPTVSAEAMNAAIESLVQRAPAQYQWGYKRFKRPPPGAKKLY